MGFRKSWDYPYNPFPYWIRIAKLVLGYAFVTAVCLFLILLSAS